MVSDGSCWLMLVYIVIWGNLREYVWVEYFVVGVGVVIFGFGSVNNCVCGLVIVFWKGGIIYCFDWFVIECC